MKASQTTRPADVKAPFPYFGGKSGVAKIIWDRIGEVRMYVEPFAGSLAVLLGNQSPASLEIVGDLDYFIANFWRALRSQPYAVSEWADYPGSHIDLHARHAWLMDEARRKGLEAALCDAEWPGDAQIAGWWCYGLAHWIGGGWCAEGNHILHASDDGRGVGKGLLHSGNAGRGVGKKLRLGAWMCALADRLRHVRIQHASWERTVKLALGSYAKNNGVFLFLDPPYDHNPTVYATSGTSLAADVHAWAREHADLIMMAVCDYRGDSEFYGWTPVDWTPPSGQTYGSEAPKRERIFFSPGCPKERQGSLFGTEIFA